MRCRRTMGQYPGMYRGHSKTHGTLTATTPPTGVDRRGLPVDVRFEKARCLNSRSYRLARSLTISRWVCIFAEMLSGWSLPERAGGGFKLVGIEGRTEPVNSQF